ncbi:hypothetical protein ACNKHO_26365 [Shigella flexneri]
MSTLLEVGYDNVKSQKTDDKNSQYGIGPGTAMASRRQHLVSSGYECLRNLREVG